MSPLLLGVNIDHVATIRNLRNSIYPDPIQAAFIAEQAGADSITIHLREDRRHITDRDVHFLRKTIQTKMNLEMAMTNSMINLARSLKPDFCCLVPEKRQEITTESGVNVKNNIKKITEIVKKLTDVGILVSIFIDPEKHQIDSVIETGATHIEIHTGYYSNNKFPNEKNNELCKINSAVKYGHINGLYVNAGHGLDYYNVTAIAAIPEINELNIGHSIISRAIFNNLFNAVKDMKNLLQDARK